MRGEVEGGRKGNATVEVKMVRGRRCVEAGGAWRWS
jgi:hypothetical protein